MKQLKKSIVILLVFTLVFTSLNLNTFAERAKAADSGTMRDMTASEIVADMGLGWNLGNTLDAHGNYQGSDFSLIAFYQDTTSYGWSMSDKEKQPFSWSSNSTGSTATLTWDMSGIKSTDDSKVGFFGFQLWNFSGKIKKGDQIAVKVTKAEIKVGSSIYPLDDLLGDHTITMDGGVGQLGINYSNSTLTKSGQLKNATLVLTVSLPNDTNNGKVKYFETVWGNPVTTKAMIDKVKAAGFNAVRVPVSWFTNMDADGNVSSEWMNRVEEVVNYVLDNDMYCVLNVHHDTAGRTNDGSGWLRAISDSAMDQKYIALWKQIATNFKDYGDHLLFEGFNEILTQDANGQDIWGFPGDDAIKAVNHLNQIYVDTVRATGGNNAKRHLIVNTYAASTRPDVMNGFVLPKDTLANHLIVEVHDYTPMEFGWYDVTWTTPRDTWGTDYDKANLDSIFNRLDKRFVSQGTPVIVGEFGTCNKKNDAERAEHAAYFVAAAKSKGITCFWWDNGGEFEVPSGEIYKGSGLLNRRTLEIVFPKVVEAMVNAAYSDKTQVGRLTISSITQQIATGKALKPTLTIKDGSKELTLNQDYSVSYTNNTKPGKAIVTISGLGDYTGSTNTSFIILPKKAAISSVVSNKSGTAIIKWNKVSGATGYQVLYSTSKTGYYKELSLTSSLSQKVIKMTKGKTYYFKTRAYITIDGIKYYGEYSDPKSVKTK